MPFAVRWCRDWKLRTAAAVALPKDPEAFVVDEVLDAEPAGHGEAVAVRIRGEQPGDRRLAGGVLPGVAHADHPVDGASLVVLALVAVGAAGVGRGPARGAVVLVGR